MTPTDTTTSPASSLGGRDPAPRTHLRFLVLAVTLAFLAVPLAGCVGGSGGGPAADTAPDGADGAADANGADAPDGVDPSDLRPHVHDRWIDPNGDRLEEIAVVDDTVEIEPYSADDPRVVDECRMPPLNGGPQFCFGKATFFPGTWSDGTGKIVPPGTARVEVTLSFSSGDFDGLRFFYQHRMSQGQWKSLGTFEAGETKTIAPVPVQISDDGHAQVSAWRFHIEPKGNPDTAVPEDTAWYGDGPVQVQIVAHRADGPLPLEPAHPLFFGDDTPPTDTYRLSYLSADVDRFVHAGRTHAEEGACATRVANTCLPTQMNSRGLFWMLSPGYEGARLGDAEVPDELTGDLDAALVPPPTRTLGAVVRVSGDTTAPVQVCFRAMSTPEQGPYGVTLDCRTFDGGELEFTVDQAVTGRDVDSFYTDNTGQNASRWTFLVQITAPTLPGDVPGAGSFSGTVEAAVFATATDGFEPPEWGLQAPGGQA